MNSQKSYNAYVVDRREFSSSELTKKLEQYVMSDNTCNWCGNLKLGSSLDPFQNHGPYCSEHCKNQATGGGGNAGGGGGSNGDFIPACIALGGMIASGIGWLIAKNSNEQTQQPLQQTQDRTFSCHGCHETVAESNYGDLENGGVICPFCGSNNSQTNSNGPQEFEEEEYLRKNRQESGENYNGNITELKERLSQLQNTRKECTIGDSFRKTVSILEKWRILPEKGISRKLVIGMAVCISPMFIFAAPIFLVASFIDAKQIEREENVEVDQEIGRISQRLHDLGV